MTMWMSRSPGTFASTRSRNLRNSRARWRGKHLPMILPWRCRGPRRERSCRGACSRGCAAPPARGASARGAGNVQGLDLALFVDTENQGTIRRRQIQTDDVADLLHEEGSLDSLGLRAMRLQAEGPPDAMNGRGRVAARPRHRGLQWVASGGVSSSVRDHFRDGVIADLTRRAGAGFSYRPSRPSAA